MQQLAGKPVVVVFPTPDADLQVALCVRVKLPGFLYPAPRHLHGTKALVLRVGWQVLCREQVYSGAVVQGIEVVLAVELIHGRRNAEIPQELQELENEAFLQIISGEKPVDYFDTFVVEWYANGGKALTERVQNAYESGKN